MAMVSNVVEILPKIWTA